MADSARATEEDFLSYESSLISVAAKVMRKNPKKHNLKKLEFLVDGAKDLLKFLEEDGKKAYFNFKTQAISFENEGGCKTVSSILALMSKVFSADYKKKAICFLLIGNIISSLGTIKE